MHPCHTFLKPLVILTILLFMLIKLDVMAESRVALVIGNSEYKNHNWSQLSNASNDAKSIKEVLIKYGFNPIIYGKNLTQKEMESKLQEFVQHLTPISVGLFYYAGHGVQVEGENYLIPIENEFNINDINQAKLDIRHGSISAQQVIDKMQHSRLNIIILDACRENPLNASRSAGTKGGLSQMYAPFKSSFFFKKLPSRGPTKIATNLATGTIIGYATAPNQTASDFEHEGDHNGFYTKYLLKAMSQPGISIETILKQTATQVAYASEGTQIPWRNSSLLGGDFCFTPCKTQEQVYFINVSKNSMEEKEIVFLKSKQAQRKWIESSILFQDYLQDGSLGPEMVVIPAGVFTMGDIQNNGDRDEKPIHKVTLKQFAIGRYEVTVGEFQQFVQTTNYQTHSEVDSKGCYVRRGQRGWGWREKANWQNSYIEKQGAKHPVVCVNWNDAIAYVEWLKEQTGQPYSLPSEAQWEYMARSNTHSDYWWGNKMGNNQANCWETSRWHQTTSPVGSFPANSFKVYDTIGNVWEWVADDWHCHYGGAPYNSEVCQENENGKYGKYRILRGGSWVSQPLNCRVSERFKVVPTKSTARIGFRVAIKELN